MNIPVIKAKNGVKPVQSKVGTGLGSNGLPYSVATKTPAIKYAGAVRPPNRK